MHRIYDDIFVRIPVRDQKFMVGYRHRPADKRKLLKNKEKSSETATNMHRIDE